MAKVNVKIEVATDYQSGNYLFGVSSGSDILSVSQWYSYADMMANKMKHEEGSVWVFMKSVVNGDLVYKANFDIDCNGGTATCPINFVSATRVSTGSECVITFSSIARVGAGDCSISFTNITKAGDTEAPTEVPVTTPTEWTYPDYGAASGYDYENTPFTRQSVPLIPFALKSAPWQFGVTYGFREQQAKGIASLKRFPAFNLRDCTIHIFGPWYSDANANVHFSRGITSMTTLPELRKDGSLQDVRALPFERKNEFLSDEVYWDYALILANELSAANPSDPRIAVLRKFGTRPSNEATLDEASFVALGRRMWDGEKNTTSFDAKGIKYWTIDIEFTTGWDIQRYYQGWIYKGFCEKAAEEGQAVVPIAYSNNTFVIQAFSGSEINSSTGLPKYLDGNYDVFANNDPLLTVFNQFGGMLVCDSYLRGIWNEDFYQKNDDGSYVINSGRLVFNTRTPNINVYGQIVGTEANEAFICMRDIYTFATRLYLLNHQKAGQYPADSTITRNYLANAKLCGYTRYTQEGMEEISQNDRPIPLWTVDMWTMIDLFVVKNYFCWGVEFNYPQQPLGAKDPRNNGLQKYSSHGVLEGIVNGAYKYSVYDQIHEGNFKWCWFNLPLFGKNEIEGHFYYQKAIMFGKIRPNGNKAIIELLIAYPGSDSKQTDFFVWVDNGTTKSQAYKLTLGNGKTTLYEAWQLPASYNYADLQGMHIYIYYKDVLDVDRFWRGDYRQAIPGNVSVPSLFSTSNI